MLRDDRAEGAAMPWSGLSNIAVTGEKFVESLTLPVEPPRPLPERIIDVRRLCRIDSRYEVAVVAEAQ